MPQLAKDRPKRSPRATLKSRHHNPKAHALEGSRERLIVFRARALELRMQGYSLEQIGFRIRDEFELTDAPSKQVVHLWIGEALSEIKQTNKERAEQYVTIVMERSERIVRQLLPCATNQIFVERTRIVDGMEVKIVDERVLDEQVKAAAEVRKQGESVLRALGVTRPDGPGEKISTDGMRMFVIQTVTNHIARDGEVLDSKRERTVLELTTGDPEVDEL